jgi:hypothetical protein
MSILKVLSATALLLFSHCLWAAEIPPQPWEATAAYSSLSATTKNGQPQYASLQMYRLALGYFPEHWTYHSFYLGGELSGVSIQTDKATTTNATSSTIVALAPILRFNMLQDHFVNPFLELTVGPAYISETQFGNRNLAQIHFTFQDAIGIGAKINTTYPIVLGIRWMHYSNGSISQPNPGLTLPIVGYVGVDF